MQIALLTKQQRDASFYIHDLVFLTQEQSVFDLEQRFI